VSEGGETSSVIGAILKAHSQWKETDNYNSSESSQYLYFVYNNPEEVLLPFDRSREVLEEDGSQNQFNNGSAIYCRLNKNAGNNNRNICVRYNIRIGHIQNIISFLNTSELEKLAFIALLI